MKNFKLLTLLLTAIGLFCSWDFKIDDSCLILHQGTFKYGDGSQDIVIKIKGISHKEYHQNGKYMIDSEIKWVNDCEYDMTMKKITIPDFPYGPGDVMNVKIDKVFGNEIYYTSTVKRKSWRGKMIKVED